MDSWDQRQHLDKQYIVVVCLSALTLISSVWGKKKFRTSSFATSKHTHTPLLRRPSCYISLRDLIHFCGSYMWLYYALTHHHIGSADLNRSDIRQASEQERWRRTVGGGGGVNDRSGTRWEESQRTINSFRNLPFSFFTSPYLWCSPLVKGRLCRSL